MAKTRPRSPSPEPEKTLHVKKLKTAHVSSTSNPAILRDPTECFASNLFDPSNVQRLHNLYKTSEPYKYTLVEKLFQDELLMNVKDECLSELHFTEKETDIYKVHQTGDLASLSYLTESQIALLPHILKLRDALYSPTFRTFLQKVTGCGALSGIKQDMSVNTYRKGCHLLNHDDVIGTRCISYILYMPLPHYQGWQKEWGGALELYPVVPGPNGILEPEPFPTKSIPPSWNQFIFFEVQPGRSFHSVEEVVVGEGEDGRQRLSISGWFHTAQPGEEGYEPDMPTMDDIKSSREQLASTSTQFKSYPEDAVPPLPDTPLTEGEITFLSEFLNPVYLQHRTMKALAARFIEESSLELHDFLCAPIAAKLDAGLRERDARDGLGPDRAAPIPPHRAGAAPDSEWAVTGPPHKWRYSVLAPARTAEAVSPRAAQAPDRIVRSLQDELFASRAFRAWLAGVSRLLPLRHAAVARRFRPGLDYTLATSEAKEARLDVVLGLTPQIGGGEDGKGKGKGPEEEEEEEEPYGWETGEWGGWECYMAPHDEEDDPAVYRSGSHRKKENGANGHVNGHGNTNGNGASSSQNTAAKHSPGSDIVMDGSEDEHEDEDDEEEDGTLLTVQPGFNRLLLVLRDEGVMHFVKYVSAAAQGSRWDVCGEYEVGLVEEEDDS